MFSTFGDLASTFHARTFSAQLKSNMTRLGGELTTGLKADLSSAVSRDFGPLASIEHSLKTLEAYRTATNEAATIASAAQFSMGAIQTQSEELYMGMISASTTGNVTLIDTTAFDARQKFIGAVSQLNTSAMGRTLFAGAATDGPALMRGEDMLDAIKLEIAGAGTAADVSMRIDTWFDDPAGGFATSGYLGADTTMGPLRLGNGESGEMGLRADDPAIKNVLKAMVKSAVIAEGALNGDVEQQTRLVEQSSNELLSANGKFTVARAAVGSLEARIEDAQTRNGAEKSSLEISRNELRSADPYDTAAELHAVQGQLESLYTVTAFLSKLSFTDYMR
ncbi:flagellin [Aliiroseovarius sp. KMU-50]|uniref:Flagellin n=1 Tax=Aliiroseovarius salicola TaxID=3009082 RepID=A0ABT4W3U3_9RHOB|nr:flagellin [Aliiroseovarius sp. KMU-50]MDA5095089.1 flagellin [Aliiroseovarius sp. KMU-50]